MCALLKVPFLRSRSEPRSVPFDRCLTLDWHSRRPRDHCSFAARAAPTAAIKRIARLVEGQYASVTSRTFPHEVYLRCAIRTFASLRQGPRRDPPHPRLPRRVGSSSHNAVMCIDGVSGASAGEARDTRDSLIPAALIHQVKRN